MVLSLSVADHALAAAVACASQHSLLAQRAQQAPQHAQHAQQAPQHAQRAQQEAQGNEAAAAVEALVARAARIAVCACLLLGMHQVLVP